jgi:hypothetical protein
MSRWEEKKCRKGRAENKISQPCILNISPEPKPDPGSTGQYNISILLPPRFRKQEPKTTRMHPVQIKVR